MTFIVIIGTVALQSSTARLIAIWLGVVEPDPKGFLIVGANPLARTIATVLQKNMSFVYCWRIPAGAIYAPQ